MGSIAVIGLGCAGGFAVEALRAVATDATLVGVDPQGAAAPAACHITGAIHTDLAALQRYDDLRVAIVATPTDRHVRTVQALLEHRPPALTAIWSEKPAATVVAGLEHCIEASQAAGVQLRTLLHTAYAPEVLWGAERIGAFVMRHGPIVATQSVFLDPYQGDLVRAVTSLGSSWLDSGINAISVLSRFVTIDAVLAVEQEAPLTCKANLSFEDGGGTARVTTTWTPNSSEKTTILEFADGAALELVHHAASARLLGVAGETLQTERFNLKPLAERYETLLTSYLNEDADMFPVRVERHLNRLCAEAAEWEAN